MEEERYRDLHQKWTEQGLNEQERDEFGRIIMSRVDKIEKELRRENLRDSYDLHHVLPKKLITQNLISSNPSLFWNKIN